MFSVNSWAINQLSIQLGDIETEQWQASGLELSLDLHAIGTSAYRLNIQRFKHESLAMPLEKISINCMLGQVNDEVLSCEKGRVLLDAKSALEANFSFQYHFSSTHLALKIDELVLDTGSLSALFVLDDAHWSMKLVLDQLNMSSLLNNDFIVWGKDTTLSGKVSGELQANGVAEQLNDVSWKMDLKQVNYESPSSELIAEGLGLTWSGQLESVKKGFSSQQHMKIKSGAMLTPFAYLEVAKQPINLSFKAWLSERFDQLNIHQLRYQHKHYLTFNLKGQFKLAPEMWIQNLSLNTTDIYLKSVYEDLLQPVLTESAFESLAIDGQLDVQLKMKNNALSALRLGLKKIDIADKTSDQPLYEIAGLNGRLIWKKSQNSQVSQISWDVAEFFQRIPIGKTQLALMLEGEQVKLLKKVKIPIYDGALLIEKLQFNYAENATTGLFQGIITPISMLDISQSLGWPSMSGKLSGIIPKVTYNNGAIAVDGTLLVQLFNGNILLKNVQLKDVFGVLPTLKTHIELKNLDLKTLTQTFSFGEITGKLSGEMKDLQLENWQPVAFDAFFKTPEDDNTSHRISQRAVDNISNLGGAGIAGAISRSFLRFFEDFHYSKLGISCVLKNGICRMGGVENIDNAYYLVKGGGIPRINIKGYNRDTDWNLLIAKLQEITQSGSPIIE